MPWDPSPKDQTTEALALAFGKSFPNWTATPASVVPGDASTASAGYRLNSQVRA